MNRSPTSHRLLVLLASLVVAEAIALGVLVHRELRGRSLDGRLAEAVTGGEARAKRLEQALASGGPYALAEDPRVGFQLRPARPALFHQVEANIAGDGLRVRPWQEPEPDALHVVFVGDSVVFGFGVADDETYAHELREFLAQAAPDRPAPQVTTVACPGWNHQSSLQALRNRLGGLDPDVVLYFAVNNDLEDLTLVTEAGLRRQSYDPVRGTRFPAAVTTDFRRMLGELANEPDFTWAEGLADIDLRVLEPMINTAVTPESRRRYEAFVEDVADARLRVEAAGAAFGVVLGFDHDVERLMELHLLRADPELPLLGLFRGYGPVDALEGDSHPNARCVRAGSLRIARFLMRRGWVPGAGEERLPAPDERYEGRQWELEDAASREAWWQGRRAQFERFFWPFVDIEGAQGLHQFYGGVRGDGTLGSSAAFALKNPGAACLAVTLERLPRESGVYPLALELSRLNESGAPESVGRVEIPCPEEGADPELCIRFDVGAAQGPVFEGLLEASSWVSEPWRGERRPVSVRLRRLALETQAPR